MWRYSSLSLCVSLFLCGDTVWRYSSLSVCVSLFFLALSLSLLLSLLLSLFLSLFSRSLYLSLSLSLIFSRIFLSFLSRARSLSHAHTYTLSLFRALCLFLCLLSLSCSGASRCVYVCMCCVLSTLAASLSFSLRALVHAAVCVGVGLPQRTSGVPFVRDVGRVRQHGVLGHDCGWTVRLNQWVQGKLGQYI